MIIVPYGLATVKPDFVQSQELAYITNYLKKGHNDSV
jgi:hypothetical protein